MAVANTKSTAITNADATPVVITNRNIIKGPVFCACATVEVAAADDDGSVYRMVRLPSNARVISMTRFNDAITAGTVYDLGVYQTAANGGAVVDADVFATDADLSSASVVGVEMRYEVADINGIEKRLWEVLGLTSDPQREYDIAFTGDTVGTAAGTISLEVLWTV